MLLYPFFVVHQNVTSSRLCPDGAEQEDEEPSTPSDLCVEDDPDPLGEEQKQTGSLDWRVYHTYWLAVGGVMASCILMALFLMQGETLKSRLPAPANLAGYAKSVNSDFVNIFFISFFRKIKQISRNVLFCKVPCVHG